MDLILLVYVFYQQSGNNVRFTDGTRETPSRILFIHLQRQRRREWPEKDADQSRNNHEQTAIQARTERSEERRMKTVEIILLNTYYVPKAPKVPTTSGAYDSRPSAARTLIFLVVPGFVRWRNKKASQLKLRSPAYPHHEKDIQQGMRNSVWNDFHTVLQENNEEAHQEGPN
ncbi:hypothetical protein Ddc_23619 [Ditylenchus destructor]|nr:hypothetical protein Ddc_23619 [Ditylenchus destructor]